MTMPDQRGAPDHADMADPAYVPPAQAAMAGPGTPAPAHPADRRPSWRCQAVAAAALALVAVGLFLCYVKVSRTVPVTSDGAGNALQAWSMLHGNWLLQGWWLSDVSFYTTELPEYMLVETVRGLTPDVVHVAAALTYTLLVLGAAWLARGQATGWAGIARMLLAGGIMLAPQAAGVPVLLLSPDHVGSAVPVLAVLLLLDRAPPRWWVPTITGIVLTGALVADRVLIVTAVLPLLAICAGRVCYGVARRRPLRSRWLELSLIGAAVVAVGLSSGILVIIAAHGGFTVWPVRARLVSWPRLLAHLKVIPHGLALLFGASTASHAAVTRGLALLHLAGLGLAIWGAGTALWRFPRLSLVDQLLVGTVLINLLAYILFTPSILQYSVREYSAVLPLSAALAGRMAGRRLLSARLAPVTAAVLAGYVLSLASVASAPSAPPPRNERLAHWLLAHHLDYGLGGYGSGNATTLDTGNQVHIVVVVFGGGRCYPLQWEAQASSYDARLHDATFLVQAAPAATIRKVFGTPDHVYHVGAAKVLVWHKNLLTEVQPAASPRGPGAPIHHAFLPWGL
jgi:hypothetical protein